MSPGSYSSSGGGGGGGDAEFRSNSDVDAASRYLADAMQDGGEVRRRVERSSTDEELGRIAQAMVFIIFLFLSIYLSICLSVSFANTQIHTYVHTYIHGFFFTY